MSRKSSEWLNADVPKPAQLSRPTTRRSHRAFSIDQASIIYGVL